MGRHRGRLLHRRRLWWVRRRSRLRQVRAQGAYGFPQFYTGWGCRMSYRKWNSGQNGPHWPVCPFGPLFYFIHNILRPHPLQNLINFISRADRFESETQIKGCLLPALGFLEGACEVNHNRYSWNRKKIENLELKRSILFFTFP